MLIAVAVLVVFNAVVVVAVVVDLLRLPVFCLLLLW